VSAIYGRRLAAPHPAAKFLRERHARVRHPTVPAKERGANATVYFLHHSRWQRFRVRRLCRTCGQFSHLALRALPAGGAGQRAQKKRRGIFPAASWDSSLSKASGQLGQDRNRRAAVASLPDRVWPAVAIERRHRVAAGRRVVAAVVVVAVATVVAVVVAGVAAVAGAVIAVAGCVIAVAVAAVATTGFGRRGSEAQRDQGEQTNQGQDTGFAESVHRSFLHQRGFSFAGHSARYALSYGAVAGVLQQAEKIARQRRICRK